MNYPKKRKRKNDNPYILESKEEGKYYIVFRDSRNVLRRISVSEDVFLLMDRFELDDIKELNEFSRHIEHLDIIDNDFVLYKRTLNKEKLISDLIEQSMDIQKLFYAINKLSNIQKGRIVKYYFEGKNENQIANEEGVSQQSVHIGLSKSLYKLKEILKSLYF